MSEGPELAAPDARLRAALGELSVPDHDDQFWHGLGERLMAERDAPAAPTLDPLKRLEQVDRRDESTEEEGGSRREERRRRRVEPSDPAEPVRPAVAQLAEHAEWVRKPQRSWPRRMLVTACVLLAALVIGVAIWVGATAEKLSPTVTAGQLADRMSGRLGEARYILGGVTTEGIGTDNGRYAFVRASNGSFRYRGLDERSDIAYDAGSGTAQSWRLRQDGTAEASEDTGLAPGPPDADGSSRYLRDDELGAIVRTLKASPATLARPRRQNGRDVWVVDVRLPASSDARVDNVRLVIDQRRQLPVEISRSVDGVAIQRKRFTDLRLASEVRPGSFQVEFPVGAQPARLDNMFQRGKLPSLRGLVDYPPATPGWLPRGFELSTAAVLAGSPPGLGATAGGDNPPNRDVVSLVYRRGVEQLAVTLRRVGEPNAGWRDPFASGTTQAGRVQQQRLDSGRFLGTTVEQVTTPGGTPHLWGRTSEFVFTVAGDLEPSQLLRVANSLN